MKIKLEDQLGFWLYEFEEQLINATPNDIVEDKATHKRYITEVLSKVGNKDYYISSNVLKESERINIPDLFSPSIFKDIRRNKRTFLVGKYKCFKYCWISPDTMFVAMFLYEEETSFIRYFSFTVNVVKGIIGVGREDMENPNSSLVIVEFFKLLTFIELAEIQIVDLKPNQATGTKRLGKIKNVSPYPFTLIDTHWNKSTIRTEGFVVSGHYRLQPYGEKRSKHKLIWIEAFEKHGYVRKATKLHLTEIS